jgi:hypothetical protein
MATTAKGNASAATGKARSVLAERHKDEYAAILGDERERLGLPRFPRNDKKTRLARRIKEREATLAKLRAELEQLD